MESPELEDRRWPLRTYFGCLTSALAFLHDNQIRHKDIKPQNILIQDLRPYFTDFGVAVDWSDIGHSTSQGPTAMTPRYSAPEVASSEPRSSSADIWSLGCVFLEMWTVLRGGSLKEIAANFTADKQILPYHSSAVDLSAWIHHLHLLPGASSDQAPSNWLNQMLVRDRERRCSAYPLLESIRETSMDPSDQYLYMCRHCLDDEETAESVPTDSEEPSSSTFNKPLIIRTVACKTITSTKGRLNALLPNSDPCQDEIDLSLGSLQENSNQEAQPLTSPTESKMARSHHDSARPKQFSSEDEHDGPRTSTDFMEQQRGDQEIKDSIYIYSPREAGIQSKKYQAWVQSGSESEHTISGDHERVESPFNITTKVEQCETQPEQFICTTKYFSPSKKHSRKCLISACGTTTLPVELVSHDCITSLGYRGLSRSKDGKMCQLNQPLTQEQVRQIIEHSFLKRVSNDGSDLLSPSAYLHHFVPILVDPKNCSYCRRRRSRARRTAADFCNPYLTDEWVSEPSSSSASAISPEEGSTLVDSEHSRPQRLRDAFNYLKRSPYPSYTLRFTPSSAQESYRGHSKASREVPLDSQHPASGRSYHRRERRQYQSSRKLDSDSDLDSLVEESVRTSQFHDTKSRKAHDAPQSQRKKKKEIRVRRLNAEDLSKVGPGISKYPRRQMPVYDPKSFGSKRRRYERLYDPKSVDFRPGHHEHMNGTFTPSMIKIQEGSRAMRRSNLGWQNNAAENTTGASESLTSDSDYSIRTLSSTGAVDEHHIRVRNIYYDVSRKTYVYPQIRKDEMGDASHHRTRYGNLPERDSRANPGADHDGNLSEYASSSSQSWHDNYPSDTGATRGSDPNEI